MKLLLCKQCSDVRKLDVGNWTYCNCGGSRGRYLTDGKHAQVLGNCVTIGLDNHTLSHAIRRQPNCSEAQEFVAFVFPRGHERVDKVDDGYRCPDCGNDTYEAFWCSTCRRNFHYEMAKRASGFTYLGFALSRLDDWLAEVEGREQNGGKGPAYVTIDPPRTYLSQQVRKAKKAWQRECDRRHEKAKAANRKD